MSHKEYRPTLAQMRTFVTIAENKHFGTAAQKLGISQPSLSQALVALESGLGVQLIERSTRRVIVTPIGEALLPHAKATLDAADIFMAHAQGEDGVSAGPLTIGMIPTATPYLLPTILDSMNKATPSGRPCIVEDQTKHLLESLREGSIDCAVVALPIGITGLTEIPLYDENFAVVLPDTHPFAGRTDLTLDDLRNVDLDLLLLDDGHCLRDQVINLCHQSDISIGGPGQVTTRAASLATVIQCVAGGLGVSLIPSSAVPYECDRPGVAIATFAPSVSANRSMALVYRTSSTRTDDFTALANIVVDAFHTVNGNSIVDTAS